MAPNKTLAAQLYSEFREFFPNNAVEYFVSYYDYYQPEAYVPSRDLYIEKDSLDQRAHRADAAVGDQGDPRAARLRHRRHGVGDLRHRRPVRIPQHDPAPAQGDKLSQRDAIKRLTEMQYQRNDLEFKRGMFRVRGDVIDIFPAENAENAIRVSLFDDEVETLQLFDPLTGQSCSRSWRASRCFRRATT